MEDNVKLNGLEDLRQAIDRAEKQLLELRIAFTGINTALRKVEFEAGQPPAGTDG